MCRNYSPGYLLAEMYTYVYEKTCTKMVIEVLLIIAHIWKPPESITNRMDK